MSCSAVLVTVSLVSNAEYSLSCYLWNLFSAEQDVGFNTVEEWRRQGQLAYPHHSADCSHSLQKSISNTEKNFQDNFPYRVIKNSFANSKSVVVLDVMTFSMVDVCLLFRRNVLIPSSGVEEYVK
jgi:hypothetical protein